MFSSWLLIVMSLGQGVLLLRPMNIHNISIDAIFQSGLVNSRSKSTLKGHQNTFSVFLDSMIAGSKMAGPVDVDINETAVNQLWEKCLELLGL